MDRPVVSSSIVQGSSVLIIRYKMHSYTQVLFLVVLIIPCTSLFQRSDTCPPLIPIVENSTVAREQEGASEMIFCSREQAQSNAWDLFECRCLVNNDILVVDDRKLGSCVNVSVGLILFTLFDRS